MSTIRSHESIGPARQISSPQKSVVRLILRRYGQSYYASGFMPAFELARTGRLSSCLWHDHEIDVALGGVLGLGLG
jgi:hypothetical protein